MVKHINLLTMYALLGRTIFDGFDSVTYCKYCRKVSPPDGEYCDDTCREKHAKQRERKRKQEEKERAESIRKNLKKYGGKR